MTALSVHRKGSDGHGTIFFSLLKGRKSLLHKVLSRGVTCRNVGGTGAQAKAIAITCS